MRTTATRFAAATGEWEAVFESLPTPDEGWATAKAVAEVLGTGWSASLATRRLNALEEGGRVESSTDKAKTGVRGRAWRQRADRPRVLGGIETVELPAADVEPDPVQRYVDAAERGVFDEIREDSEPDPRTDPAGRACETCGATIHPTEAEAGYTRCDTCDPDGEHSVHGEAPAMSADEANEEFDGLPTSMMVDDTDRALDVEPIAMLANDGEGDGPVTGCDCEDCEELAKADPKADARPVVLVASPIAGQAPARAEVWENDPNLSVVKVVYCDSRTGARVARSRILGPVPADPTAPLVDDEDGDPSPVSPAPTGGDYTAIAEALAPAADPLSAADARALTDRIRIQVTNLLPLIKEAYNRRAHISLGYDSWAAYCDTELRGLRMPLAERQAATVELRGEGMSTRAIAGALGSSDATVRRDLSAAAPADVPERSTGLDGRSYPARKPKTAAGGAHISPPADGAEGALIPPDDAPAGDGGAGHAAVPGNPQVWIATARKGVDYHRPIGNELTYCGRSMRTGELLFLFDAKDLYNAAPCARCWPEPAAGTAPVDVWHCQTCAHIWPIVPGEPNRCPDCGGRGGFAPLTAVETPSTSDTTDSQAGDVAPAGIGGDVRSDRPGTQPPDAALVGEVVPSPARRPQPDPERMVAVADDIVRLRRALDGLEDVLLADAAAGGPLTVPDLKHERRRLDKLIRRIDQAA